MVHHTRNTFRTTAGIVLLAAAYFCAAKLGLSWAFVHKSASPVWPAAGIALAAILLYGYRLWPGIFLGAVFANVTTAGTITTSLGIAAGNTVESVAAVWLLRRFAHGPKAFQRPQDIFKFVVLAALLSPMISATIGVASLSLGGVATWQARALIWATWWLGDVVGVLTVAPFVVVWATFPRPALKARRWIEAVGAFAFIWLIGQLIFGGWVPYSLDNYPVAFLSIPPMLWVAFRFGPQGATIATMLLSSIALRGTLHGYGPFGLEEPNESLLIVQAFIGTVAVTKLLLASIVSEHRRAEQQFRVVVEAAPNAMLMVDQKGRIALVNSQAERLFGYSRQELLNRPVEDLIPTRFRSSHPRYRQDFLAAPQMRPMGAGRDLFGLRKNGTEVPIEIGLSPIALEGSLCVLASIIDITERKRAEQQIQASLREKEVLLKEIHHRVKNNLQVVSSLLSLQVDRVKERGVLELFRESQNRIRSMALIHESLSSTEDLSQVDLRSYLQRLASQLVQSYGAQLHGVELELDVDEVALSIDAAVPCGLILTELVSNAIKHAFSDGRAGLIRISLHRGPADRLTLTVSDTGPGFPPGVDALHSQSLGLRLVHALASQLRGTLTIDQQLGTTVTMVFIDPKHTMASR